MEIETLRNRLLEGLVIPACPLTLNEDRTWSERHQRALARYYSQAGAGGLAVGVHSTQFAIREPDIGLFEPVLELVSTTVDEANSDSMVKIAGICGLTQQAGVEANTALRMGYHAGLLSMTAFKGQTESKILDHCRTIADIIPVIGFYLQPAVGGQIYTQKFWRRFAEIPNVVAIKIAPFNRYQTWDVVRAVIESGRKDVALYTGNDDNIIVDLMTAFEGTVNGQKKQRFINGGLLGQWGVWTQRAVQILDEIKKDRQLPLINPKWLSENAALTDANAALFDAANGFAGCIPGIMEVLRRSGLCRSNACLDPAEKLSPGQSEELDRVIESYPHFVDNEFVAENLDAWLE